MWHEFYEAEDSPLLKQLLTEPVQDWKIIITERLQITQPRAV